MQEDSMNDIFKIFDPVILGAYPSHQPATVDNAIRIISILRSGQPLDSSKHSSEAWDLAKRACLRTGAKLDHFIRRTRSLGISPESAAPKDVADVIIMSILLNDSATNLPYDMFYVQNQSPRIVAKALRNARIIIEDYLKLLDFHKQ